MIGNARRQTWSTTTAAALYEFVMQVRRPAVWIVVCLFVAWGFGAFRVFASLSDDGGASLTMAQMAAAWSLVAQYFVPLAFGILVADRLPRDGGLRVAELLETLPGSSGGRLLGKYLGATLATLVPLVLIYAAGVGYLALDRGDPTVVPLGALTFAAINLPGLLFVASFSVACPAVLWVPLYQVLFAGYWFWGNLLNPDSTIPTISGTVLAPVGWYPAAGFFGLRGTYAGDAAAWEAAASAGLLLGLAVLALLCAHCYLRWQHARQ